MADPSPPAPASIPHASASAPPEEPPPAAATSPSTKSQTPPRLPSDLLRSLSTYVLRTNITIARINKLLSTTTGLDTTLSLVSYTSLLLTSLPAPALRIPFPLARLSPAPLPSPSKQPHSTPPLRAVYTTISDLRIFLRTLDLLKIYASSLALTSSPPPDYILRYNAYIQLVSLTLYQALENVAYLSSKGILFRHISKQRRAWLDAVSCQFWTAWVVGDLVRVGREWQLRGRRKEKGTEGEIKREKAEQESRWRNDIIVNAAFLPLCLHWSFERGVGIPEWGVGLLGSLAGVAGIREAWGRTL